LGLFILEKRRFQGDVLWPFSTQRELIRKVETDFLIRPVTIGQGVMVLK